MEESSGVKKYKLVVIGGSAGSLGALISFFPLISNTISVAIIIVLHRKETTPSLLPDILSAKTVLPVREAEEKEPILSGHIYVAPPNYHLLIEQDRTISLDDSEKVNYSRPSIDITFQSAADVYKSSLAGILLSGANADGADGLQQIANEGGVTVVQDPATAEVPFMPAFALSSVTVNYTLSPDEIARFINNLP